jgi:hypothetical protein
MGKPAKQFLFKAFHGTDYGTLVILFSSPTSELPDNDEIIIEAMGIDFEPDKGETFGVEPVYPEDIVKFDENWRVIS